MKRVCPFCHFRASIDAFCPMCGASIEDIEKEDPMGWEE